MRYTRLAALCLARRTLGGRLKNLREAEKLDDDGFLSSVDALEDAKNYLASFQDHLKEKQAEEILQRLPTLLNMLRSRSISQINHGIYLVKGLDAGTGILLDYLLCGTSWDEDPVPGIQLDPSIQGAPNDLVELPDAPSQTACMVYATVALILAGSGVSATAAEILRHAACLKWSPDLDALPEGFELLKALQVLHISQKAINKLDLGKLPALRYLDLYCDPTAPLAWITFSRSSLEQLVLDQPRFALGSAGNLPFSGLRSLTICNPVDFARIPHTFFSSCRLIRELTIRFGEWGGALPASLARLHLLEELHLDFSSCNFDEDETVEFPELICLFKNLRKLSIVKLPMGKIPDSIQQLSELEELSIPYCGVWELPALDDMPLACLDVSYNELEQLPALPPSLESLNASYNNLSDIGELPAGLKHAFLAYNSLGFPEGELVDLLELDLQANRLSDDELPNPAEFQGLSSLRKLTLSHNCLCEFPLFTISLHSLESLDLWDNNIDAIPDEIASATRLTTLLLSNNPLSSVPAKGFGRDCAVQVSENCIPFSREKAEETANELCMILNAPSVRLDKLETPLDRMPEGQASLQLQMFPEDFALKFLDEVNPEKVGLINLSDNSLEVLPQSLLRFRDLRVLILEGNSLSTLPDFLFQMPSIETVFLAGNPIGIDLPRNPGTRGGLLTIVPSLVELQSVNEPQDYTLRLVFEHYSAEGREIHDSFEELGGAIRRFRSEWTMEMEELLNYSEDHPEEFPPSLLAQFCLCLVENHLAPGIHHGMEDAGDLLQAAIDLDEKYYHETEEGEGEDLEQHIIWSFDGGDSLTCEAGISPALVEWDEDAVKVSPLHDLCDFPTRLAGIQVGRAWRFDGKGPYWKYQASHHEEFPSMKPCASPGQLTELLRFHFNPLFPNVYF